MTDPDCTTLSDAEFARLRERLCKAVACIEHGSGTTECPVPTDPEAVDGDAEYFTGRGEADERLSAQTPPSEASCPDCGADPTAESVARHRLSDNGYLHDDIEMTCSECDRTWVLGVPIGEPNETADLVCGSCDERMLVHRVSLETTGQGEVELHLKCPNCYLFRTTERALGANNVALVGYPAITGDVETDNDYGYPEDAPPTDGH